MAEDDTYQALLFDIEKILVAEYEKNPNLTDNQCIFGLENAKIAVKQHFGFGKSETVKHHAETDNIINNLVQLADKHHQVNNLTPKEFITQLDKISRSVRRHSEYGHRAYYQFVKDYIKNKKHY